MIARCDVAAPSARGGPRRLVATVLLHTAFLFALRHWVAPRVRAIEREQEERRAALRAELGREPTGQEVAERMLREKGVV